MFVVPFGDGTYWSVHAYSTHLCGPVGHCCACAQDWVARCFFWSCFFPTIHPICGIPVPWLDLVILGVSLLSWQLRSWLLAFLGASSAEIGTWHHPICTGTSAVGKPKNPIKIYPCSPMHIPVPTHCHCLLTRKKNLLVPSQVAAMCSLEHFAVMGSCTTR